MVKLSDRLRRLADEVYPNDRVADIGTDHGLLPIFLYENKITKSLILCDINEGPLEKARENIKIHRAFEIEDLRRGDGLEPLEKGEVDVVIIAGMGGRLMIDILGKSMEKSTSFKRWILQPRNAPEKLRKWLWSNGCSIVNESLVREGKYICEVMTVAPGKAQAFNLSAMDFEISPLLFEKRDPLLIPFIEKKIDTEEKILRQIKEKAGERKDKKIQIIRERVDVLIDMLEKARRLL